MPATEGDAEYAERTQANLAWLRQGFDHAKASNSRAIMVLQQANLFPEFPPFPGTPQSPSGYTDLRVHLQKEAAAFGKPIVLVHGDSHFFRIDKPLSPRPVRGTAVTPALENFTRVETFGSPYHHWVHVSGRNRTGRARGEVHLVRLDPTLGSEIQKTRPCLVVSPDELNQYLRSVMVAPMTTSGRAYPWRIACRFQRRSGFVAVDQLRTVDAERLPRRLGRLTPPQTVTTDRRGRPACSSARPGSRARAPRG